jgi:hypothetical protein
VDGMEIASKIIIGKETNSKSVKNKLVVVNNNLILPDTIMVLLATGIPRDDPEVTMRQMMNLI